MRVRVTRRFGVVPRIGLLIATGLLITVACESGPPPEAPAGLLLSEVMSLPFLPIGGLSDLVNGSTAIVIATVGDVVTETYEVPNLLFAGSSTPTPPWAWSGSQPPDASETTYYSINVEDVLRDDGQIESGGAAIVRIRGHMGDEHFGDTWGFGLGARGVRYLYFLHGGGGGGWYGIPYAHAGRLVLDGAVVTLSNGALTPAPFAEGLTPAEFLDEVYAEISAQQTATPTPLPWLTPPPTPTSTPSP